MTQCSQQVSTAVQDLQRKKLHAELHTMDFFFYSRTKQANPFEFFE